MLRAETLGEEWEAWWAFVGEFEKLYGPINPSKNNRMVMAIRLWGEHLSRLRVNMNQRDRERELLQAEKRYRSAVLKGLQKGGD